MSRWHFGALLIVTVIAALAAFLVPRDTARETGGGPEGLLPELAGQVNELDWLRLVAQGENIATMRRGTDGWVLEEASGYRADWPRLHELLSGLAAARVIEYKTTNPAYYERLGVEDPGGEEAAGILIEFSGDSGLPAVIIGKRAQGRDGQYLRLADSERSVLVDREFDLPREAVDWLDREVIDISRDEIVEVGIRHADGERVVAKKVSADDAHFKLQDVPQGREPKSEWNVDSLAGGLDDLELEAVLPADELDWSDAVLHRVVTADGLDIAVQLVSEPLEEGDDPRYWLRLEAGLYTTGLSGPNESGPAAERARALNEKASGWAYRIPQFRFDDMTRRMDDLVRDSAE